MGYAVLSIKNSASLGDGVASRHVASHCYIHGVCVCVCDMGVYGMSVLKKENLGGFVKRMVILCFHSNAMSATWFARQSCYSPA